MKKASLFYISGFFLTVSPESILHVAKHASESNKYFTMNLSAPFLSQFYKEQMLQALPYVDVLFGNESEALAFAQNNGNESKDIKEIALYISTWEKVNKNRERMVVITQGSDPTIVAFEGSIKEFSVPLVPSSEIIDTNGAGDSFVGAFLAKFIGGKTLKEAVDAGHALSGHVIRRSGCSFPSRDLIKGI
jgi:adenosine kinase